MGVGLGLVMHLPSLILFQLEDLPKEEPHNELGATIDL